MTEKFVAFPPTRTMPTWPGTGELDEPFGTACTSTPPFEAKLPGWFVVLPSISLAWKMPRRPRTVNVTPFWKVEGLVPPVDVAWNELVVSLFTMIRVPANWGRPRDTVN